MSLPVTSWEAVSHCTDVPPAAISASKLPPVAPLQQIPVPSRRVSSSVTEGLGAGTGAVG